MGSCGFRLFSTLMGVSPAVTVVFRNVVRYDDDIQILVVEHELLVSESDIRRQK